MVDWEEISQLYAPLVWRTAFRLLGNHTDAADCFQETFLSAVGVTRRQQVQNWPAMLQHLATARALDCLRRRKAGARQEPAPDWDQISSTQLGPEQLAGEAELVESVRSALTQLPSHQSEIFCLRNLNGLSYEEIAREMEISVDAVGMALHRARGRLRELLGATIREPNERR